MMGLIQSYMEALPQQPPHLYSGIVGRACLLFLASKVDHDVIELPSNWKPADFASHLRQRVFFKVSLRLSLELSASVYSPTSSSVWLRWCWFKFFNFRLNRIKCTGLFFSMVCLFCAPNGYSRYCSKNTFFFFIPKTFETLMITLWFIYDSAVRLSVRNLVVVGCSATCSVMCSAESVISLMCNLTARPLRQKPLSAAARPLLLAF